MAVKVGVGQNNGSVHGGPLQLVSGGGVAVVDMGIILGVKDYARAFVKAHLHF